MPYKDKEIEKLYYTIGEVAALFEVNASLIRFWEKEFEILQPTKNKKGNRLFTKEDIQNLKMIYHLVKERGFTLQGARDKLKESPEAVNGSVDAVQSLQRVRSFLLALKSEL
jgi:DNA-binding transcriptional MerR regulator